MAFPQTLGGGDRYYLKVTKPIPGKIIHKRLGTTREGLKAFLSYARLHENWDESKLINPELIPCDDVGLQSINGNSGQVVISEWGNSLILVSDKKEKADV